MDNFIVSARKYRPDSFDTVVGQKNIASTLKNAIKNNHLAHAYLFCGPRGVGKTTSARIFAKTINCSNISDQYEACGECESCKAFEQNRSYNIHELDAASNNSVEDIRTLIEKVRIPPQIGTHSVYIIDEVHMLSSQAFNAFLKTLEEPPPHARFILATTEKHKILPTILSRCQIFDFNRIKVEDAVKYLQYVAKSEGVEADLDALNIIAQKADGAMRDALSFFDQIVSFAGKKITYQDAIDNLNVLDYDYYFKLLDAFLANNISNSLLIFDEILGKGFDGHHFITGMAAHFRDLLVCKDQITIQLLEVGASIKEKYKVQATNCEIPFLLRALNIANQADLDYRNSSNKRLLVELTIMKITELMCPKPVEVVAKTTVQSVENQQVVKQNTTPTAATVTSRRPVRTSISMKGLSNGMGEKQKTNQEVKSTNLSKTGNAGQNIELTAESVKKAWEFLAEKFAKTPRLYHSVKALCPTFSGTTISISVTNENLKGRLIGTMGSILKVLRSELKNNSVTLEILIEEQTREKVLYTDNDKFMHLNKINSNLHKLKDKFNLDFK